MPKPKSKKEKKEKKPKPKVVQKNKNMNTNNIKIVMRKSVPSKSAESQIVMNPYIPDNSANSRIGELIDMLRPRQATADLSIASPISITPPQATADLSITSTAYNSVKDKGTPSLSSMTTTVSPQTSVTNTHTHPSLTQPPISVPTPLDARNKPITNDEIVEQLENHINDDKRVPFKKELMYEVSKKFTEKNHNEIHQLIMKDRAKQAAALDKTQRKDAYQLKKMEMSPAEENIKLKYLKTLKPAKVKETRKTTEQQIKMKEQQIAQWGISTDPVEFDLDDFNDVW